MYAGLGRPLEAGLYLRRALNGSGLDTSAPFGGYKQSGLGREWGAFGMEEFLEIKAVMGYG